MILIFDTETTGLGPRNVHPTSENFRLWDRCRIVEIAWELFDTNHQKIDQKSLLIQPNGYVIPESATKIHGISQTEAYTNGVLFGNVVNELALILPSVTRIIAHNISFDVPVLSAELYRHNRSDLVEILNEIEKICTMKRGTKPYKKWPKLGELYKEYFNILPENVYGDLHRADVDVRCCADIYFHQEKTLRKKTL